MERVVPRKIVEVLPSGAALTWTEGDDAGATRDAPGDGRRVVEVLPSGAELSWIEGGSAAAAEVAA